MTRMTLVAKSDDHREHVIVELHKDGAPLGHILLAAPDAESFAHKIADQRAKLSDEVPRDLDPGARLTAIIDPVWRTARPNEPVGIVLALRHPGLGWMTFALPDHEAHGLGQSLVGLSRPPEDQ